MKEVKFIFHSEAAAQHFLRWLCASGEQDYFGWMELQEDPENSATRFDYWGGTKDGSEFGKHPVLAERRRVKEK